MQTNASQKNKETKKQWFSRVLILIGLVVVGFGLYAPIKDQLTLRANQPPPPPPNLAMPELPPSLADNPLPVIDFVLPTVTASSTALPTPTPLTHADGTIIAPATPNTATPSPTPNPYPPAQSVPDRIVAESINLDSTVESVGWHEESVNGQRVSVWDVAEYAAGWLKNSALPGHAGNVVLSGHHNIKGEVFRYIVDLEAGDRITLYADGRPYDYIVENKFIVKDKGEPDSVRRENARWIGPFDDQRLTLTSCWPYTNNTHRVIVIAKPDTTITPAK